ncbi:amino acid permease [Paenibacillus kobensis]|uniref:amino acid permease n=1 Tax=Paenibacillus kobensis TaxID=59841 RepID=UPI001FE730F7|nr:amino acid permease [Paenibacillus kobensis]
MIIGMMALAAFAALCAFALFGAARAGSAIRSSRHQSYGISTYAQYVHDKDDLNRLGYPQLLLRRMGSVSSFGMSFNQLGMLGGAAALYTMAIDYGGQTVVGWGWLLLGLFGIAAGAAMAELCSAFPTAGGPYHWALALGGVRWSWITGWLHTLGNAAMIAFMNYFGAQMTDGYLSSTLGYEQAGWTTIGWMVALYVIQWRINTARLRGTRTLLSLGVWIGIGGAVGIIAYLAWSTWPGIAPVQSLFDSRYSLAGDGASNRLSSSSTGWLIGVLLLQRMFVGSEGAAAGAEETADPRVRSAWSVFLAPVYVFVFGFVLLSILSITLPLSTSWGSISFASWIASAVGTWSGWEPLLILLCMVSIVFSSLQGMNALSRSLFAMSRDGALPDHTRLSRVSARTGKPTAAITAAAIISGFIGIVFFSLYGGGEDGLLTIAGFAIAAIQFACAIPISLRLFKERKRKELRVAPWQLGRASTAVHWTAWLGMVISVIGCVFLINLYAGAALLIVTAVAWMASLIRGERFERKLQLSSRRTRVELQRIERKFGPLFLDGK